MSHNILECYDSNFGFYHQSLDRIEAAWNKLNRYVGTHKLIGRGGYEVKINVGVDKSVKYFNKDFKVAACIATALAIVELEKLNRVIKQ